MKLVGIFPGALVAALLSLIATSCGQDKGPEAGEPHAAPSIEPAGVPPGEPDSTNHSGTDSDIGLSFVATAADLPACDEDLEGKVVYVKASRSFQGCSSGKWEPLNLQGPAGKEGAKGADGTSGRASRVKDASGADLGLLLLADWGVLTILSSNGFIYTILWDGSPFRGIPMYYTSNDCSGRPHVSTSVSAVSAKAVFVDDANELHRPSAPDANGNAVVSSYVFGSVRTATQCTTHSYSTTAIELTPISRADAGIPDTIVPRIEIVGE